MRKSIILLVVLALLAGFGLMSCKNEVATQDTLSEVCISLSEERGVTGTVTSSIPDVSDLYWFYVATKADKRLYATGATAWKAVKVETINEGTSEETTVPAKGLTEGTLLGLFSQGDWKFSFYGFTSVPVLEENAVAPTGAQLEEAVYYAKNRLVTVDNARANVNITLTAGDILSGKVVLDNLKFNLDHVNSDVQLNAGADGSFVLHVKYSDNEGNHDIASKTADYVPGTKEYSFFLPVGVVDNKTVYESTKTIADIADGTYTYTFEVVFTDNEDTPNSIVVATEDVGVTISKGTIVTFRGDVFYSDPVDEVVIGEITGEKQATASFTVSSGKAITVSANVTPASVDSGSATTTTTVEFPKDSLKSTVVDEVTGNTTSYDHDLKVEVAVKKVTATSETFVIGTTETPVGQLPENTVAGIDLTLTQTATVTNTSTQEQVGDAVETILTNFEDNAVVTVSTYIATGLLNVDVYYNGLNYFNNKGVNTPYLESYDAATGLLKFKTNHFSDFWVTGTEPVAKNGTKVYLSLEAAVAEAEAGDTVVLLKDYATATQIKIYNSLTLDLGGKTLEARVTSYDGSVLIENGTITGRVDAYDNVVLTIAADAVISNASEAYVVVWGDGTYGEAGCKTPTLNVYGTVTNTEAQAISTNGGDMSDAVINIYEGAVISGNDHIGIYLPSGKLVINGGTITGSTAVYMKSEYLEIKGGTLVGNLTPVAEYEYNGSGANATGDALVIDSCGYPNGDPVVKITGGTFIGTKDAIGYYKLDEDKDATITVTGGLYSSNPKDYLAAFYGTEIVDSMYRVYKPTYTDKYGVVYVKSDTSSEVWDVLYDGSGLTVSSYVVPKEVKAIEYAAFYSNQTLTSISFEEGSKLSEIGSYAFSECYNLEGVIDLSDTKLLKIGDRAFCFGNNNAPNNKITAIKLPQGLLSIGERAFKNCRAVTTFGDSEKGLPSGVVYIGNSAFQGCSSWSDKIVIPSTLPELRPEDPDRAGNPGWFIGCSSITCVEIPEGTTYIGEKMFDSCGLTSVTIPSSVRFIAYRAFYDNAALAEVTILSENVVFLSNQHFMCSAGGNSIVSTTINVPENSTTLDNATKAKSSWGRNNGATTTVATFSLVQ